MIDALRAGDGLPRMRAVAVNEVTQVGLEAIAAAFAYGEAACCRMGPPRRHRLRTGRSPSRSWRARLRRAAATIETDDPMRSGRAARAAAPEGAPAGELPRRRQARRDALALRESARGAAPVDMTRCRGRAVRRGRVNVEGCTLCLACVRPVRPARSADPERPMLRFIETPACNAACAERPAGEGDHAAAARLPRATAAARVLKEEEPFACVRCSKPFGVKSTIERVSAKLEGKHWMFKGSARRLDVIRMCEDCRVAVMAEEDFDPYGAPRPLPRTTDDYLREREQKPRDGES
jgi:hypothetical protein